MSTTSPKRKPSRMPCFTQTLTRQPVGDDGIGLGGAHAPGRQLRAQPRERLAGRVLRRGGALLEERGDLLLARSRHDARAAAPSRRSCCSTRHHLLARRRARRHQRQPIALLDEPHRRHRRLARDRIGLDEVDLDERQQPVVQLARAGEVALLAQLDDLRHLRRRLVRGHRDDAARRRSPSPPPSADRRRSARRKSSRRAATISDICTRFADASLIADDVRDLREPATVVRRRMLTPVRAGTL